jgi:hypothetical protein
MGIDDACFPTGMAVVFANKKAYFYYAHYDTDNSKYVLCCVERAASSSSWKSRTISAPNLQQNAQISVTSSTLNHVVYLGTDGHFEHFLDKWQDSSS